MRKLLFAHFIGGLLLVVYQLVLFGLIGYVARKKRQNADEGADTEFRIMRYQSWSLLYHVYPFLVMVAIGGLDFGYIRRAMALNDDLPSGTPPVFSLGPFGM